VSLKERYDKLKEQEPKLRIRNAAEKLNVSEVELLSLEVGANVVVLKPEFQNLLGEIESLGKVMALTRNDEVVHERKGIYKNATLDKPMVGLFVGADIDLRVFFASWKHAFAVKDISENQKHSIQFFAKDGSAIHKIYLTPDSHVEAFDALVEKYTAVAQEPVVTVDEKTPLPTEKPDSDIDTESFQEEWKNLKDTHHFFGMLKKYGVTRTQALRMAPEGEYATKIDASKSVQPILELVKAHHVSMMVFVGNQGMIQIHTGPVKRLLEFNEWYNVMDPDFNLHINVPKITDAWVVRKPTDDGMVTAMEFFNENGEQVMQFFGARKPGLPELEGWREIVAKVESDYKL
jgi:putative hemin transport protein